MTRSCSRLRGASTETRARRPLRKWHAYAKIYAVYAIEIARSAVLEIGRLRPFHGRIVLNAISEKLGKNPTRPARNKKLLNGLDPPFDAVPPVWELRVGDYRVFYDVSEEEQKVYVRAVRRKAAHKTTKEIL